MGGYGSGYRGCAKDCTDDMRQVDVRSLQRDGRLKPGTSCRLQWSRDGEAVAAIKLSVTVEAVTFTYRHQRWGEDEWRDVCCSARLTQTPCGWGGSRTWWRCPCCFSRVAILYIGKEPACRRCMQLAYRSEREDEGGRAIRRANTIRARLGWPAGVMFGLGTKPKGMHWRTYWRMHDLYNRHAPQGLQALQAKIAPRMAWLEGVNKALDADDMSGLMKLGKSSAC